MLEAATGRGVYDPKGWSVEEVQELVEHANWDFEYDPEEIVAYWSAKYFLEACAEAGLSISFSW